MCKVLAASSSDFRGTVLTLHRERSNMQFEQLFLRSPPLVSDFGTLGATAEGGLVQRGELAAQPAHSELSAIMLESKSNAHCAPRASAFALVSALAEQAGVACARADVQANVSEGSAERQNARAAGQALLHHMMQLMRDRSDLKRDVYVKGDTTHRLKLRMWQAVCVLACFLPADEQPAALDWLLASLHRFDVASVKQYQERGAVGNVLCLFLMPIHWMRSHKCADAPTRHACKLLDHALRHMLAHNAYNRVRRCVQFSCGCSCSGLRRRLSDCCPCCKTTAARNQTPCRRFFSCLRTWPSCAARRCPSPSCLISCAQCPCGSFDFELAHTLVTTAAYAMRHRACRPQACSLTMRLREGQQVKVKSKKASKSKK